MFVRDARDWRSFMAPDERRSYAYGSKCGAGE
jgi:hypothetical protein